MSDRPFDMPSVSAGFDARGGWVVNRLMAEPGLGLTNPIHAAAIVGNLGGESGLRAINERHPMVPGSRGGWSWAQWTGPRRNQFEAYAGERGLPLDSDQAAYEFLVKELAGSEKHALDLTKKTTKLEDAVLAFEVGFERPSDPQGGLPSRIAFAKKALAAAGQTHTPVEPEPEPEEEVDKKLDDALFGHLVSALQAMLTAVALYDGEIDGLPGPKTFQAMMDYAAQE